MTVTLTIDGKSVTVPKGTTVYTAATQLGADIPIFCYQDRMPPFGACRVCLVENEKTGKLATSCTLEATEGMAIKTQSQMAQDGRQNILEFLLINHPLDCPICDRGGECPLQEQTLKFGPGESRFYEDKRHFTKAKPLGPVLMLDRERCIVCARCTRFGDLIAGDHALEFIDRGYKTEVGTPDGGPADSKYIGNTIMICPVGALTSTVYRFRARPWDNQPTASACTLCPIGCSLYLDARDGEIMRTRSREDKAINDIWLCDKGWFGYEFSSSPERLKSPWIRKNGALVQSTWDEAIGLIASNLKGNKIGAIGGTPLTTEENDLYQKLFRGLGTENIDFRVGLPILTPEEEGIAPGMEMSIGDSESLDYAYLLGVDLTEEFPLIWLRLRQAINKGAKVVFLGHFLPEIAPHLEESIIHTPGKEVEVIRQHVLEKEGKKGAVFVGSQYLNSPNRKAVLAELLSFKGSLNILEGSGNSQGSRLAGMLPKNGLNSRQIFEKTAEEGWDYLHVAGANPAKKMPEEMWKNVREKLKFLVVHDLFMTETAAAADVVLPILSYVEKGGTFITIDGHSQTLMPGKELPEGVYSDGEVFEMIAQKLKIAIKPDTFSVPSRQRPSSLEGQSSFNEGFVATFAPQLFDNGVRMKHDPHVIELAKEPRLRVHPKNGFKEGETITLNGKLKGKIKLDSGVADNTVVIPLGFDELPAFELGLNLYNGLSLHIQREGA